MKPVRMYLDEAKERGIVINDKELGARLHVSPAAVCEWRKGRSAPNEDQAAALAELLGKPEVLAECMAARAKRPETRAVWERAARMLSMTAAFFLVAGVNLLLPASTAEAAPVLKTECKVLYYVKSKVRRAIEKMLSAFWILPFHNAV